MNKIYASRRSEIAEALEVIPSFLHPHLLCDLFEGHSPVGIVHGFDDTGDGRSFKDTAHVAYEWHSLDRRRAMVLPNWEEQWVIVHEFGHVLHDALLNLEDFALLPCTEYAESNYLETFAEAFTSWALPWYGEKHKGNIQFFESLRSI